MKLDIAALGFDDIELEEDELPDGAILLLRTQMSGDRVKMVCRTVGGDLFVHAGILRAASRQSDARLDSMQRTDEDT